VSDFIAERIWPGARLERSIFGTDDPEEIWRQALAACPEAVDCFAFRVGVGAFFGLVLNDASRIALKIQLEHDKHSLEVVQRVQDHLVARGFPCPRPLGVRGRATLEAWCDDGVYRDAHAPDVRRAIAEHLAELIRLTSEVEAEFGSEPSSADEALWPPPHNALFDFEATARGAEWIDAIARAAKRVRNSRIGRVVIAHGDWTANHFRFEGLRPTVIYDWNSLGSDHETTYAGTAAASFTYTEQLPVAPWPTVAEATAFLDDFERARGSPFDAEERRATHAAAVYACAYAARCNHAVGKDAHATPVGEYAKAFLTDPRVR
jgi:hypothetical protein